MEQKIFLDLESKKEKIFSKATKLNAENLHKNDFFRIVLIWFYKRHMNFIVKCFKKYGKTLN